MEIFDMLGAALEMVNTYVSGELILLLIPLWWIGSVLKKSNKVSDELIPDVLSVVGFPFVILYQFSSKPPTTTNEWVCLVIVSLAVSVFLGLSSVGANQLMKQHGKAKSIDMFAGMEVEKEEE